MIIISFQDLQTKKQSVIAKQLEVKEGELRCFLDRLVITKDTDNRLRLGQYNRLRKKK